MSALSKKITIVSPQAIWQHYSGKCLYLAVFSPRLYNKTNPVRLRAFYEAKT